MSKLKQLSESQNVYDSATAFFDGFKEGIRISKQIEDEQELELETNKMAKKLTSIVDKKIVEETSYYNVLD